MNLKQFLLLFIVLGVLLGSCSKFTRLQKSSDIMEKYNGALQYYEKKDYYRAGVLIEEVMPLLRGTEQAEKAQFYRAYCFYMQRQLLLSGYHFKLFVDTYPRSPMAEEASYMYCLSLYEDSPPYYLDQTSTQEAIIAINNFFISYPDNPNREKIAKVLAQCKEKLELKDWENAKLFHKKEDYKAALVALDNFTAEYPESKYNEESLYLQIETNYYYARNSVDSKKKERYESLMERYESFVDRFPNSPFLKKAELFYKVAQARVSNSEASEELKSYN